jgi:heme-degrading monooxygenase HmoA
VIVCLRTVVVPADWRQRYLAWIEAGRTIRQQHGILAELVCQPHTTRDDAGDGGDAEEMVVMTMWPSHEVFDAWIATPHRDALTASDVHRAVTYRPITRYDVPGGYLNLAGLTVHDPTLHSPVTDPPEESP